MSQIKYIPDHLKTKELCDAVIKQDGSSQRLDVQTKDPPFFRGKQVANHLGKEKCLNTIAPNKW